MLVEMCLKGCWKFVCLTQVSEQVGSKLAS
jgi:hypothetical protein